LSPPPLSNPIHKARASERLFVVSLNERSGRAQTQKYFIAIAGFLAIIVLFYAGAAVVSTALVETLFPFIFPGKSL
jgi:hypothetical protein